MAIKRSGLFRSLANAFRGSGGRSRGSSSGSHRRRRFESIERLEPRTMLTTTVFVDFGEGLNRHIITTAGQLRRDLIGPDVAAISAFGDDSLIEVTPLQFSFLRLGIDFNDDGRSDINDWTAFRNTTVELVRQAYAPFDVNVEVAAASSTTQIKALMARNNGDPTGQFDSYVWATGIYDGTTGGSFTLLPGLLGIASAVDLIQTLQNVTDEAVVVDGEAILSFAQTPGFFLGLPGSLNYAVVMARTIAHEAGHTFALRHTNSGGNLFGLMGADQDMLTQSDIIREGPGSSLARLNRGFFTHYPLMLGDGNTSQTDLRNPFEQLANDPDIGLRNNAPRYVTGTGAFDRITITRLDSNTASVKVEPFRDNTFTAGSSITIATGGMYSYVLNDISPYGIVVEGGRGDDQIIVDGLLSVPVVVRGGQGFDQLRVTGTPLMNAIYTPDTSYRFVPGFEDYNNAFQNDRREFVSYSGTIVAGFTQIRYDEFDDAGSITFDNFASVQFGGSAGFDNVTIKGPTAGINEVDGTVSGVGFPNMRYTNVKSVVIDTGATAVTDAVTVGAINATGLAQLTVSTGAGSDFINVSVPNLQIAGPLGAVIFDFGTGSDTLNASADVDWTLTDSVLASSLGGSVSLQGLFDETANLLGGVSNNTFHVGAWSGGGRLIGQGGLDTVEITRDANFSFGENFVNVLGVGGFLLSTVEALNLTGGPGANTFFDYGWNGRGILDGGLGATDTIAGFRDSHFTLSDTVYNAGNNIFGASLTLMSVELASLNGGAGFNQFDVSSRTTPAAINGGGGQDVVVHSGDVDHTLTNNALTISGPMSNFFSLANIEVAHLTGGGGNNTFTISQWAGSGFMVGGGGDDTFIISTGNLDALAGPWNVLGGFGTGDRIIVNDFLGSGGNYIVTPNSVSIAPGALRRFGGVFFDGTTEDLRLNANNGPNRIDVTPSLGTTFTIDGNASADALVLHTAFTGPPNGPINGPGAGQRRFTFNAGHRDVIFEDIEQLLTAP